jgi:hypothetical protein
MSKSFEGVKMKSVILGLLFITLLASPVWAGSFSIDFNDHSTQLGLVQRLNSQSYGDTLGKLRYLYNDDSRTNLVGISGGVLGAPGNVDGLKLGVDVALNGGQTKNDQKVMAVGLGFSAEYSPAILSGLGFDTHLVYSPKIFTFLDSEDYFEWGVGARFKLLPNARITLAFQNIQVDIKDLGNKDLDETVRFGIEIDF